MHHAIAVDLSSKAIELYNILVYFLSFLHGQVVQLVFHISNRVMRAENGLQFRDKLVVTVHPDGMGIGVGDIEQVGFEPLKGHAPKVGLCVGNLSTVHGKCLGLILEIQLT